MGVSGRAIRDLHQNRPKGPFYACCGDSESEVDPGFYLNDRPTELERRLLSHARGRCLDIGCGAGRTLRALQRMGLAAVGIDIDADLVALCRERGLAGVEERSWEDMDALGAFDTVLMLNHSIGMAGSLDGTRALLAMCFRCAAPGGVLLFDSRETSTPDGSGVLIRELRDKYAGEYSEPFAWISFSRAVAESLARDAGWRVDDAVTHGGKYGLVCRKPDAPRG